MADNELLSFISGGNTGVTYPELARRRAIAAALAAKQRAFPKTMGEGMTYLGESLGEVWKDRQTNEMEARLRAQEATSKKGAPSLLDPSMSAGAPAFTPASAAAKPTAFFEDPNAAPQEVAQGNPTQGGPMVPPGSPSDGEVISDAAPIGGPGDQLALSKTAAPYAPVMLPTSLSPRVPEQPPAALALDEEPEPTPTSIRPAPMQVAQAGPAGLPSSMFNLPPPAFGGAPAAPARRVDAFPPAAGAGGAVDAPNAPPSRQPIEPASEQEMKDPGAPPARPPMMGMSKAQRYWMPYLDNPDVSPELRAHAQRMFNADADYRKQLEARSSADYTDQRERWQQQKDKYDDFVRKAPERRIEQHIKRLQIEKSIADENERPLDAAKKQLEIDIQTENLGKLRYEATQRPVNERKLAAETATAEQMAAAGKAPPTIKINDVELQWDQATRSYKPIPEPPTPTDKSGIPDIKLTAEQDKLLDYHGKASLALEQYNRIPNADEILAEGLKDELVGKIPFFGNAALSSRYRTVRNAANNFLVAHLRRTSGAVIGAEEMTTHMRDLVPIYGDDPTTMRNKREQRTNIVEGMNLSLGKARPLAEYRKAERQREDAVSQTRIAEEMRGALRGEAPEVGRVYQKGKLRRYWTGSRWEDD